MDAYDHLDAAAMTQPGGFADSLTRALSAAINGYGNSQDRIDARAGEMARLAISDKRHSEESERAKIMLDLALSRQGAYGGDDAGLQQANQDALDESEMQRVWRQAQTDNLHSVAANRTMDQGRGIAKDVMGAVAPILGLTYKDGVYSYPKATVEKPPDHYNFGDQYAPNHRQWDPATKTWRTIKFPDETPTETEVAPVDEGPGFLQRMADSVGSLFADAPAEAGAGPGRGEPVMPPANAPAPGRQGPTITNRERAEAVSTGTPGPMQRNIPPVPDWMRAGEQQHAERAMQAEASISALPPEQRRMALAQLAQTDPAAYQSLRLKALSSANPR
jgi:hypothetical protein